MATARTAAEVRPTPFLQEAFNRRVVSLVSINIDIRVGRVGSGARPASVVAQAAAEDAVPELPAAAGQQGLDVRASGGGRGG